MDAQTPDAVAMGRLPPTGFHVNWDGANVELQIPASSRGWPIVINGILSFVLFGACLATGWMAIQLWSAGEDTADFCSLVATPLFEWLFLWLLIGSIRRTARPFRRGPLTRLGVTHGTLWCNSADAPETRYYWPAEEIWRLRIEPGRISRVIRFEVRSSRRPVVRLNIPCRAPVDTRPLVHILEYAINGAIAELHKADAAEAEQPDGLQYAKRAGPVSSDATLSYFGDEPLPGWVSVGAYEQMAGWWAAQVSLSRIDILGRLDSVPGREDVVFKLLVPESQAEKARRWLAQPETWRDRSRCPSCGEKGTPIGFFHRIARSVRIPTRPIALSKAWRLCDNCRQVYLAKDG